MALLEDGNGRSLSLAALVTGCVALTLFFAVMRFPFDRLAPALESQLSAATGMVVTIQDVGGGLSLGGPGIRASGVSVHVQGGSVVPVDALFVRPAWSISWLRGRPALYLDLEAPWAAGVGTLWPNPPRAADFDVAHLDLEQLPPAIVGETGFSGVLAAEGALDESSGELTGSVEFEAHDGSLALPNIPVALPYTSLQGNLGVHAGGSLTLEDAVLEGPLVSATAAGVAGPGAGAAWAGAPLDLKVNLRVHEPTARTWLAPLGIRTNDEGVAALSLGGTLGRPEVQ